MGDDTNTDGGTGDAGQDGDQSYQDAGTTDQGSDDSGSTDQSTGDDSGTGAGAPDGGDTTDSADYSAYAPGAGDAGDQGGDSDTSGGSPDAAAGYTLSSPAWDLIRDTGGLALHTLWLGSIKANAAWDDLTGNEQTPRMAEYERRSVAETKETMRIYGDNILKDLRIRDGERDPDPMGTMGNPGIL